MRQFDYIFQIINAPMNKFQLKKSGDLFLIINKESNEYLSTHSNTPYPPLPKDICELLVNDLNLFSESLNESYIYCCISSLIEFKKNKKIIDLTEDVLYQIQWDRAYRGMPDPRINMVERHFKAKVIEFLGDKMIDLPLNYAESFDELEADNTNCVPQSIINEFKELIKDYTQLELFTILLLNNLFEGCNLSMTIFWLADQITNQEFIEAGIVLAQQKEHPATFTFNVKDKKLIDYYNQRLVTLRLLLQTHRNVNDCL